MPKPRSSRRGKQASNNDARKAGEHERGITSLENPSRSDSIEFVELCVLESLQREASEPFNKSSEKHMQTLQQIWKTAFPEAGAMQSPCHDWLRLGFANQDPLLDLQGSGIMSLQHLLAVLLAEEKQKFIRPALPNMAAASISVTVMLQSYLGLVSTLALPAGCELLICSREVQSAFLVAQARSDTILSNMHLALVKYLARVWLDMQASVAIAAGTPLPTTRFPSALCVTHKHMHAVLSTASRPWNLSRLLSDLTWGDTAVDSYDKLDSTGLDGIWALFDLFQQYVCHCDVKQPAKNARHSVDDRANDW